MKKRVEWLDGLKWLACIMVFFSHFYGFFYGKWDSKPHLNPILVRIGFSDYNFLINGNFWLCTFCVISGYLAFGKEIKTAKDLAKAILNRYIRFFIPLLAVNFFAYILGNTIGFQTVQYGQQMPNSWIGQYYNFKPTLWIVLRASVKLSSELDCPLWMIYPLYIGTCFIYVLQYLKNKLNPMLMTGITGGLLLVCFLLPSLRNGYLYGMIAVMGGLLRIVWNREKSVDEKKWKWFFGLVLVFLFVGGVQEQMLQWLNLYCTLPACMVNIGNGAAAVCMLICIKNLPVLTNFLQHTFLLRWQHLSFTIYVLHWLVLSAFSLRIYGFLVERGVGMTAAFGINLLVTTAFLLVLSQGYYLTVEKCCEKVMHSMRNYIEKW